MNEESEQWLKENNGSKKVAAIISMQEQRIEREQTEDYKLKVTYADYVEKGNCDASTQRM